jgi:hypothetical protein
MINKLAAFWCSDCYEDMLRATIPQSPGPEREFYMALRSEFTSLIKKVRVPCELTKVLPNLSTIQPYWFSLLVLVAIGSDGL